MDYKSKSFWKSSHLLSSSPLTRLIERVCFLLTMKFYGALILFMTLSAAWGLRCYVCVGKPCKDTMTCPANFDRCTSFVLNDVVYKSCIDRSACNGPIKCCDTDLCNSAVPTGSSVLLLLVSSGILTLFL